MIINPYRYGSSGSSWLPTDEATMRHWYAADYGGNTIVSGACSVLADRGPDAKHLSQGTEAKRPAVSDGALNGLDVLTFDGSSQVLFTTSTSETFRSKPAGMIVTLHRTAAAQAQSRAVIALLPPAVTRTTVFSATASNVSIATAAGRRLDTDSFQFGGSTGITNSPNFEIFAAEFDWANAELRQYSNGTLGNTTDPFQTAGNTSSTALDDMSIGAVKNPGSESQYHNGDIAEVLVFESWSDTLRQKAEGYLAHKWGLEDELPVAHPYKAAPPTT